MRPCSVWVRIRNNSWLNALKVLTHFSLESFYLRARGFPIKFVCLFFWWIYLNIDALNEDSQVIECPYLQSLSNDGEKNASIPIWPFSPVLLPKIKEQTIRLCISFFSSHMFLHSYMGAKLQSICFIHRCHASTVR